MLAFDSLAFDLIFKVGDPPDPEVLVTALGGEDEVARLQLLDPDMQDPRFEMELSPSRPFRRRGERRLMMIDASTAPLREDPRTQPIIESDLREARDRLISICQALGSALRLARLFALGSWGEAVIAARSAADLRAWALQSWVLDPQIDLSGRHRASPLSRAEFEEKLAAYDKRLEELSEEQILENVGPAELDRRGDYKVLSVLDERGRWDLRDSVEMEKALAAVERFSIIPGAVAGAAAGEAQPEAATEAEDAGADRGALGESETGRGAAAAASEAEGGGATPAAAPASTSGPGLSMLRADPRPLFFFPAERFDLDVATALGKGDWPSVITSAEADGKVRDRIREIGADFVTAVEFLSEVFVEGVPLSKKHFEDHAESLPGGARALAVLFPRFGPATLLVTESGERWITSSDDAAGVLDALRQRSAA